MTRKPLRVLYFIMLAVFPLIAFFVTALITFMVGVSVSNPFVTLVLVMSSVITFVSAILLTALFYQASLGQETDGNLLRGWLSTRDEPEEMWSDEDLFGDWEEDGDDEPLFEPMDRESSESKVEPAKDIEEARDKKNLTEATKVPVSSDGGPIDKD